MTRLLRPPGVLPLECLPHDMRERIAREVAQATPPPKMRVFAGCEMPSRGWYEWHWQRGLATRREPISPALRAAVYERDGHACVTCGATDDLTLDHIYPHALGGRETLDNLQALCRSCNSRKGASV